VYRLINDKDIDIKQKNIVLDEILKKSNMESKRMLYNYVNPSISQVKIQNVCKVLKNEEDKNANNHYSNFSEDTPKFKEITPKFGKKTKTINEEQNLKMMSNKSIKENPNYGEYTFKNMKVKIFKSDSSKGNYDRNNSLNKNLDKNKNV